MRFTSIREVLSDRPAVVVRPDATLSYTCDLMAAEQVTALAVVCDGRLCGFISEEDIIRHVSQRGGFGTVSVEAVMARDVCWIETRGSLVEALVLMQEARLSHLPVVDNDHKVVGVLAISDIPADYHALQPRYVRWREAIAA